jgi:ribosome-binding factor A
VVSKTRTQRIGDRIREELSEMLLMEVSDPRLQGISVTDVEVDRELAYASVYISALEGEQRWQDILDGLEHAQGFLRHELSQRIDLRTFPRLRFRWDSTLERAEKIERLIASIHQEASAQAIPPGESQTLHDPTEEGTTGEENREGE